MNAFIFRLERLFQLRAKVERQRAQELARAVRAEQERKEALAAAAERLERSRDQAATTSAELSNAGTLRNLGITVEAAARRLEEAEEAHRAAMADLGAEEEKFGTARRERRVVERLREKRREAWEIDGARKEQKEIDGLAAQRHARKEGSS